MLMPLALKATDVEKTSLREAISNQIRISGNPIEQATADEDLESAATWQRETELLSGIGSRIVSCAT
jgi:hypothetical protein